MSIIGSNILAGASGQAGGAGAYEIERSVRLNAPDSAYLSRTPASSSNRKTWTWAGWVKRVRPTWDTDYLFGAYYGGSLRYEYLAFTSSDKLEWFSGLYDIAGTTTSGVKITSAVFRDASAWYHIVAVKDTTQATAANRFKLYVNGVQISLFDTSTDPALNDESFINDSSTPHRVGGLIGSANSNQYLADVFLIDGQALDPSSFGEFDTNGVWQPIDASGLTFGTNGFHLPFSDNSTAAALGTDTSGNGNTWTVNNISVTAGADNDSLVDSPTNGSQVDTGVGGEVVGNYATLNPLVNISGHTFRNGNLEAVTSSSNYGTFVSTIAMPPSGKWYAEAYISATSGYPLVGIAGTGCTFGTTSYLGGQATMYTYYGVNGNKYNNGTSSSYGATYTTGDTIGIAYDADAGTITFYKNGASQGQAYSGITSGFYYFAGNEFNNASGTQIWNFGQRAFAYTAPSGFKALCTTNLPESTIADGSTVMDVALYTGNGSTQTISGLNFSPDFVWIKERSSTSSHQLYDTIRGATNTLYSNSSNEEQVNANALTSFTSTGFNVGVDNNVNQSAQTYVAWTWDAGSSTVTNTEGSISSQVRANASAGFSVVTYTGNGNNATVGHGLNVVPALVITKDRSATNNWLVVANITGYAGSGYLNLVDAFTSRTLTYTSTTFRTLNASEDSNNGANYVAYCFALVSGYSAMGTYSGNGSDNGPFVYTGFRPRWIMVKSYNSGSSSGWEIYDTARSTANESNELLRAAYISAETSSTSAGIDILSNGFKLKADVAGYSNYSGWDYIYYAVAENPFQYARAR